MTPFRRHPGARALLAWVLGAWATLVLTSCTGTDEKVLSEDTSVYAVLEVRPLQGEELAGRRLGPTRIVVVDLMPHGAAGDGLASPSFPLDCNGAPWECVRLAGMRGGILLRTVATAPLARGALGAWGLDEARVLEAPQMSFRSLEDEPLLELRAGAGQSLARAEVRLVKKCPARVSQVRDTRFESGALPVPTRVRRTWVELRRPSCFAPEDLEHVLPTEPERNAEAERERARLAEQEAVAAARRARAPVELSPAEAIAYRDERYASLQARATELARNPPLSTLSRESLSDVERQLHPDTAALMHAAGLRALEIESRCIEYRKVYKRVSMEWRKGSCKRSRYVLLVTWQDGEVQSVGHRDNERRAKAFARVELDEQGALRVETSTRLTVAKVESGFASLARSTREVLGQGDGSSAASDAPSAYAREVADEVRATVEFAARNLKPRQDPDPRTLPRLEYGNVSAAN